MDDQQSDVGQWEVRTASHDDVEEVARLLHDFNTEYDTPSPGPDVLAERLSELFDTDTTIALLAGSPAVGVALVTLRSNVWYDGPVVLLDELYVVPSLRNRGIGTAMMAEVKLTARYFDAGLIEINVDEGDVDAQRFYERLGYTAIEPGTQERALYYSQELS